MDHGTYRQEHAIINCREVWHYLITSDIGNIHVVQWEHSVANPYLEEFITRDIDKAERKFKAICNDILRGKR